MAGKAAATRLERGERGTRIYLELLDRIRRGAVGADERLVDTVLAEEMEVSRMPVREALLRLVHEGYLVGTTRGFVLPRLTPQDMADIFEVRRLLEPRAAATAAAALDAAGLAGLEVAYAAARTAMAQDDATGFIEANRRFRQAWLEAAPNRRLAATLFRFVDHVQITRNATLHDPATREVAMRLLDELIAGFRRRDALGVQDVMARFVARAQESFLALQPTTDSTQRQGLG